MKLKKYSSVLMVASFSLNAFAAPKNGKYFDRVIFVLFENTNYASAMKQPYFKHLANIGANLSNFFALTHPSQGNYIALTSGGLNGVTGDGTYNIDVENIADLLEAKGLSWKVYAENYPGNCFTGSSSHGYARKHNPFISYINIQKSAVRCANIVEAAQFDTDASNGRLPEYAFYVPNENNDGHDTGVAYADKWYSKKFDPYVSDPKFMENTILVSTFDESAGGSKNQIYTSIVGPMVKPGDYSSKYTIPSILRLVEENWNLGDLGKLDHTANTIDGIWN